MDIYDYNLLKISNRLTFKLFEKYQFYNFLGTIGGLLILVLHTNGDYLEF